MTLTTWREPSANWSRTNESARKCRDKLARRWSIAVGPVRFANSGLPPKSSDSMDSSIVRGALLLGAGICIGVVFGLTISPARHPDGGVAQGIAGTPAGVT